MALCSGFVEAVKMMRPLGRSWNIGTGWVVSQSQSVRPNRRNGTFECERDKVSVIQKKKSAGFRLGEAPKLYKDWKSLKLHKACRPPKLYKAWRRPSYLKVGSP